jgi:hypothetical protein
MQLLVHEAMKVKPSALEYYLSLVTGIRTAIGHEGEMIGLVCTNYL